MILIALTVFVLRCCNSGDGGQRLEFDGTCVLSRRRRGRRREESEFQGTCTVDRRRCLVLARFRLAGLFVSAAVLDDGQPVDRVDNQALGFDCLGDGRDRRALARVRCGRMPMVDSLLVEQRLEIDLKGVDAELPLAFEVLDEFQFEILSGEVLQGQQRPRVVLRGDLDVLLRVRVQNSREIVRRVVPVLRGGGVRDMFQ